MNNTKKCRNCGKEFEARSNQLHCSHKCKAEYFHKKENAQSKASIPLINDEVSAKTAIELRRLELQHEKEMAILNAQERERQRELELKKEQEKTARFKEHLNQKEKQKSISYTQKNNPYEEEENEEEDAYVLPNSLQKLYKTTIQKVIDLQGTRVKVLHIKTLKNTLETLLEKLDNFEVKEDFEEEEHTYEYGLVSDTLDEVEEWLKSKSSLMDIRGFSIDEDLHDDLVESLETEEEE